jgi:aryl-alcohol dehydrogenase-like predicted oxidoreductase
MKLGKTGINISKQGLGCMSMSEFYGKPLPESEAIQLIRSAYQQGVNMFDTADVYAYGQNEKLISKAIFALLADGISRNELVIATKCGIVRDKYDTAKRGIDNSYDYILSSCNKNLERLGESVKYIDLFYLHRIANHGEQIDEAMQAMSRLLSEKKIKAVGLSEASAEVIHTANKALLGYTNGKHQLAAIQSEYSLMTRLVEKNGVLNICRDLGITLVAYSPLSRALLTGEIEDINQLPKDDFRQTLPRFTKKHLNANQKIIDAVKALAIRKNCSAAQIALAWVMSQPNVIPIPGTTKAKHLRSNVQAIEIKLTKHELALLDELPGAQGMRYHELAMKAYGFESEI